MIQSHHVDDRAYHNALDFLYGRIDYERMVSGRNRYCFRLQRTDQLLKELGLSGYLHSQTNQPKVPIVHIAGTKGKGSTAALVAAGLTAAGLRTGLYTSPHLQRVEERFQLDGCVCERQELVSLVDRIAPVVNSVAQQSGRSPSFFELTTAIALLHFDLSACDAIVLEVGLGGRLDSTNVCAPSVTAITSIGLDHQHILGETEAEIAAEKAGICKSHVPLVSGVAGGPAGETIARHAAELGVPLYQLGRDYQFQHHADPIWGSHVTYHGKTPPITSQIEFPIALEGSHQAANASLAIAILELLKDQGLPIDIHDALKGVSTASCPGRLERMMLPGGVTGIVDSAHNIDSIDALVRCLQQRAAGTPVTVLFGTSKDKDAASMLERLSAIADRLVLTQFVGNPRFTPAEDLRGLVPADCRAEITLEPQAEQACQAALRDTAAGGFLVVCGSFFLAAETRGWFADRVVPESCI